MRELLCNSNNDCPSLLRPIVAFWKCTIWPIICIGLGILLGTTMGVVSTTVLFLLTAAWLPLRMAKLLQVTMTTKECFPGFLGPLLRILVLFLVPIVPLCSWLGGTLLCATFGTMFFMGAITQRLFLGDYQESIQILQANVTLQPNTPLGDLSRRYHELLVNDQESHPSIHLVKAILTIVPGLVVATLVVLPYSLAIFMITVYRLPMNIYQTGKIAVRTVLLRWDLRLVVLVLLPVIHLLFPFLTFLGALIGCFFWTWASTSGHIYEGKYPGEVLHRLRTSLDQYHQVHKDFVEIHCRPYDHPTGIPNGWDGRTFGIAVERLLRFQRDLLICCILIIVELPVCFLATLGISILKYIPTCIHLWSNYITKHCCNQAMWAFWPFHLLVILFLPLAVLGCHGVLILFALVCVPFQVVSFYLDRNMDDWIAKVWNLQLDLVCSHDQLTGALLEDYQFFRQLGQRRQEERQQQLQEIATAQAAMVASSSQSMWDQVEKQCIQTTAKLLKDGYISRDQVADMEPSAIQSIPSVAIWKVLIESCSSCQDPVGPKEIRWEVDGSVCHPEKHVTNDPIVRFLWPMVLDLKRFLVSAPQEGDIFSHENVQIVSALLCSNAECNMPRVEQVLLHRNHDSGMEQYMSQIRVKITALVMALLRVAPYQERMKQIFTHDYGGPFPIMEHHEDEAQAGNQQESEVIDECPVNTSAPGISCDAAQPTNHGTQAGSTSTYGSITTDTDRFRT